MAMENRNPEIMTGLDVKRIIDAYNLWQVPMLTGSAVLFDVNDGTVLVMHADKEDGLPYVYTEDKALFEPQIKLEEADDEETQG